MLSTLAQRFWQTLSLFFRLKVMRKMDIAFCCFFHKQNKKWEDDKITTTGRVTPTIMTMGSRNRISEADHENDPLTGSLNNSAAADLGCIKVDNPMKSDDNGIESPDCNETTTLDLQ